MTPVVVQAPFGVPMVAPPEPADGWLEVTVEEWGELWRSSLADRIEPTDVPAVRRLFGWRDKQVRAERRAEVLRERAIEEPLVPGSKGQPVANPMFGAAEAEDQKALAIEGRIVALEDRLGLSPKARLGLGVTEAKGQNLAGQNAQIALALREAMAGETDPRAVEGDSAITAG